MKWISLISFLVETIRTTMLGVIDSTFSLSISNTKRKTSKLIISIKKIIRTIQHGTIGFI